MGNVIGGHKANMANPHTSDASKQHSKEVLEEIGTETKSSSGSNSMNGKNPGKYLGVKEWGGVGDWG